MNPKVGEEDLKIIIMIIVHHEGVREQLSEYLQDRHYDVHAAPHREDVSGMVKNVNPHVLVLDMYVAEPSGLNLLRQLRAEGFKGKVVALTGTSMVSLVSEAYRLGVTQMVGLPKGYEGSLDLERIEYAIRASMHDRIAKRAFEIWETKGRGHGHDLDDWLEAERQILPKTGPGKMKKKSSRRVDSRKK